MTIKDNQNGSRQPSIDHIPGESIDDIDLERLRLPQDFLAEVEVKKHLATVPIRKPDRQTWARVHPECVFSAAIIELKDTRESYLVEPEFLPELHGEAVKKLLFLAITRQGVVFLWPVRPAGGDGRRDEWSRSSMEAVMLARTRWTKTIANMSLGAYENYTAPDGLSDPVWPDMPFDELLRIAFRGRIVNSLEHPIVRQLRGER